MNLLKNVVRSEVVVENMTKTQIQLAWRKVIRETHKRPKLGEKLKEEKILLLGDLLLASSVLLEKIERGENIGFNAVIFKKNNEFLLRANEKI
ncbi:MAG: hypothetical protein V1819_00645 [bacterium]